jgi:uncharacterized RDD family membrane protein YckC
MKRFTDTENADENLWDDALYEQEALEHLKPPAAVRFVHLLADSMAVLVCYYVFAFAAYYLMIQTDYWFKLFTYAYFMQITIAVIYVLYVVLMEGFAGGQTLGKLITRYRVVRCDGTPPSLKQIILRTLIRFVPFECLSVFLSDRKGMWHDRWSRTFVVKVPDNFLSRKNDIVLDDRS